MNNAQNILNDLPPFANRKTVLVSGAMNDDIIHSIHRELKSAINQVKNIAPRFKGATAAQTARNIYQFLLDNVTYIKDPQGEQIVKLPNALLATGGDCKSYSLFTAAILKNLGLPAIFRYASYNGNPTPTHVYCLTEDEAGRPIIIDAVWGKFNSEKPYTAKHDFIMNVYSLSGIDASQYGSAEEVKQRILSWRNKLQSITNNDDRLKVINHIRELNGIYEQMTGQTIGSVKTVVLAPGRAAFLSLVDLNVRGLATKLSKIAPDKVKERWEKKLGGKFDSLLKAINRGKTKKPLLGMSGFETINGPELAPILAAAAPVIASIASFLKANGQSADVDALVTDANAGNLPTDPQASDPEESGFSPSPLLIGGALLLLMLLLKKKK